MKVTSKYRTLGIAFMLGAFTVACNQETVNDTNEGIDEAQTELGNEAVEANRDLDEFEAWVQDRTRRAETATKEEWVETRAEYKRREAEFETKNANWDEETRREWEELKANWNETENKIQQRLGDIEDVDVDVDRQNN